MANELTSAVRLSYSKGGAVASYEGEKKTDIATGRSIDIVQVVGTSQESVGLVDIASIEEVVMVNLDPTNYVDAGCVTGQLGIRIPPGRITIFKPTANALFLQANTAACAVRIIAVNS
jgi:hypothetical protein